ncbi:MAG: DUF262 domain-containing HNH endonuclease family protein [Candidatus Kapabacteria bacterium]|nr:DUF262 domain-containing HNH endonuclease family protein [Candidatus Kapabacteria bacterium]
MPKINKGDITLDVDKASIYKVLAVHSTSFFIPPFQRSYAWGRPEIERYFNDLIKIIDSELDISQPKDKKLEHFFGTIVIKTETDKHLIKSTIVDGQQRLTTTLLFLISLRDLETDEENIKMITNRFLKNNDSIFEDKIKLKQVTKDWDSYKDLVNGTSNPKQGVITNAYLLFKKLILEKRKINQNYSYDNFITSMHRLNVALIYLDPDKHKGEDPQIIFETLNSLGKPLNLSDLIRNYILLKLESEEQDNIYNNIWHPKIESVLNENTSNFFRDYLQLKTNTSIKVVSNNNTKEVYQQFKSYIESTFSDHKEFISDIVKYVPWYNWIITEVINDKISIEINKNNDIKELLRNVFHDIKSEAFKPLVLGILKHHQEGSNQYKISDIYLISILKSIRTYLVRRRLMKLTQGENKNIVSLCYKISEIAMELESINNLLSNMFYSLRIPNDLEIRKQLDEINFYNDFKKYSKFILGKIEEKNSKVPVNFRDAKITIEHIMPKKLSDIWKTELGLNYEHLHKKYLNNIGNLILTESNSELSNKSFIEKKKLLEKSTLSYRINIIKNENWKEENILDQQNFMINCFLNTFSLPDEFKTKNNWNEKIIERRIFSPLDDDAYELAEGKKPIFLSIDKQKIKIKTWQEVFIEFIKYFKSDNSYDFESILSNQKELFGRDDVIVKYSVLKLMTEENIDLENKYKSFDFKTSKKQNNLSNDDYFLHINISAFYCMKRIASIMSKFNFDESLVNIELK